MTMDDSIKQWTAKRKTALVIEIIQLDLSRICAAPSARLSHFSFEGDRAFPAQC
jgi:hypothetical protein